MGTGDERRLPPALFAHNTQVKVAQSVHAQNNVAKGVLGRLVDAVSSQSPSYKARFSDSTPSDPQPHPLASP